MPTTSMPSARPRIGSRPKSRIANGGGGVNRPIALAAEFLEPCRGIHDVAVEHDGAFDVADFANNDRTEMQAAANPRADAELALQLIRGASQFVPHRHEAAQRTAIDRAIVFRPGHDHLVAGVVED